MKHLEGHGTMKQQQQMINCTITGIGILWADPCFCTEEARTTLENNYLPI